MPDFFMYITVLNQTQNTLSVIGSNGSDLQNVYALQTIPAGQSSGIAYLAPDSTDDWDWVYLVDPLNKQSNGQPSTYQIYVESFQPILLQKFGYYDTSSTHENPNPSPFPCGVSCMREIRNNDIWVLSYTLMSTPPPGGETMQLPNAL